MGFIMIKGISAIISVVLFLMITISLVGIAFVFLGDYVDTSAKSEEKSIEHMTQILGSPVSIDHIDKVQENITKYFDNLLAHKTLDFKDQQKLKKLIDLQDLQGIGYYSKTRNNSDQIE